MKRNLCVEDRNGWWWSGRGTEGGRECGRVSLQCGKEEVERDDGFSLDFVEYEVFVTYIKKNRGHD